ncbi:MAG: ABC transporter permease [Halothiobacillaceae bacterium]
MSRQRPRAGRGRLVLALAAAQLRNDWILTLCLVIALTAVIAPLLALMGLKHGTIETLRDRLVEDPVFREIRPARTESYAPDWFDEWSARAGVQFLTPTVLPLSSVLQAQAPGQARPLVVDLVPTGVGDPLLLENGGVIPADGEVVLTAAAAETLGVAAGEELAVQVTRSRGGRSEIVQDRLRVAAVLDRAAGDLLRLYAPLPYVVDVEAYKEGFAAPSRGWPGTTPEPYLSIDGALLFLAAPLSPIERTGLVINTGFARLVEIGPERVRALLGQPVDPALAAYELLGPGTALRPSNLRALSQKLRGRDRVLLPYVESVDLVNRAGEPVDPIGLSLSPEEAAMLGIAPTPWGGFDGQAPRDDKLTSVLLPEISTETGTDAVDWSLSGERFLPLRLSAAGATQADRPVVSSELLAALNTGMVRGLTWTGEGTALEMARGGFRGFRLYADSIDSVPALARALEEEGIEVVARTEEILRIQILDRGLGRIFWLISLLGILGGTAVLIASLYAAVERLRRDLGVLRLLGLSRRHVFAFPVLQGLMIAGMGLVLSILAYLSLAWVINRNFATALAEGERLAALTPGQLLTAAVATLALACLSSMLAAWRATGIDPAEAIREH